MHDTTKKLKKLMKSRNTQKIIQKQSTKLRGSLFVDMGVEKEL